MAQQEDYRKTLTEIRDLMTGSVKVHTISGLIGICAGFAAIAGFAAFYLHFDIKITDPDLPGNQEAISFLLLDGLAVLMVALTAGSLITFYSARKQAEKLWTPAFKRVFMYWVIPMLTGGILFFPFFSGAGSVPLSVVIALSIIFFGLSLLGVSRYTLNEFFWQGLITIAAGTVGFITQGYCLIFWVTAFGIINILSGFIIFNKYEKRKQPGK